MALSPVHLLATGGPGTLAAARGNGDLVVVVVAATSSSSNSSSSASPPPTLRHAVPQAHAAAIRALAVSDGGRVIASGGDDKCVRLWAVSQAGDRLSLIGTVVHRRKVVSVAFSAAEMTRVFEQREGNSAHYANWEPLPTVADGEEGAASASAAAAATEDVLSGASPDLDPSTPWSPAPFAGEGALGPRSTLLFADAFGDVFGVSLGTVIIGGAGENAAADARAAAAAAAERAEQGVPYKQNPPGTRTLQLAPPGCQLLLGCIASVTGMMVPQGGDYVWVADKDEKLRTAQFPKTFNLVSFCMGHTQFACALAEVPHAARRAAVSGGLDGTLRVWDIESGELLHSELVLPNDPDSAKCVISRVAATAGFVACCAEGRPEVHVFQVGDDLSLRRCQVSASSVARSIAFSSTGDVLWVGSDSGSSISRLEPSADGSWTETAADAALREVFDDPSSNSDEVATLYRSISWDQLRKRNLEEREPKRPRSDAN